MADSQYIKKWYPSILVQEVLPNVPTTIYTAKWDSNQLTTIIVCNLLWVAGTFSIGVAKIWEAINQLKQFIVKDVPVIANDQYTADLEINLREWESLFVVASALNQFSINVFGSEEWYNGVNI